MGVEGTNGDGNCGQVCTEQGMTLALEIEKQPWVQRPPFHIDRPSLET